MKARRPNPMASRRAARLLATGALGAWLLLAHAGAAQDEGGTESVFRLGPTARGVSLGPAMVGMAHDASAPYWNAALLAHAREPQFAFSYNSLYSAGDGASYQYLGMVYPTLRAGGFGVGLLRLSMGDVSTFDAAGRPTGQIDYAETQLLFSYAYGANLPQLGGRWDLGLSAKIHSLELGERATSGGLDLALAYAPRFLSGFRLSWVFQNLVAPSFRLVEMEDSAPSAQRIGLSKLLRVGTGNVLEIGAAYDAPEFADARVGLGAEYRLQGLYSARVALDNSSLKLGIGGRWRAYSLDYAFRSGGELGASQFLTFSWHFGESLEGQRQRVAARREQELEQARLEAVEEWRRTEAEGALRDLRAAAASGDVESAERQLARARAFGVAADDLDGLQAEVEAQREARTRALVSDQVREVRVRQAEDRLRAAFEREDAVAAREALSELHGLTEDHPMLPRFDQQYDQLRAGAVARASAEATSAEEAGDWVTALRDWSRVAELDPAHPGPADAQARWRAELDLARDDSETARREAERARRRLSEEQQYTVALERFSEGELDSAESLARRVLDSDPRHAGALELLRRVETTRAAPRPLSPQEDARVRSFYLSGLAHFSDGNYEAAITEWERILAVDPENEGALNNIAEARARLSHLRGDEGASRGGERGDR